jgi:alkaline phosphatase
MIPSFHVRHLLAMFVLLYSNASALAAGDARNVILIIGDGMDDHQISIARNYLKGAEGRLLLDDMSVRSVSQVLTVDETGKHIYVADSANSATSMATGVTTSRGRIATSAGDDKDLTTIVELAEAAGLQTGLVTTASVTDATPASFVAHVNARYCENPAAMPGAEVFGITLPDCPQDTIAMGGPGSISEQIAASDLDVVLGGGTKHFDQPAEGSDSTVLQLAQDNGFTYIDSAGDLARLPEGGKLLGLFSESTMPVRWRGEDGRIAEQPEPSWLNQLIKYIGSVTFPAPMTCEPNPKFAGMPTLKQMTDTALNRLDNERGFFLMIESASIDKQSHERKPCGSIGELEQLEEALQSALAYAAYSPNTLILVTADHGQAAQLTPDKSMFSAYGIPVFTPGHVARIITPENAIMSVNYATNNFFYEEHTGVAVPLFANQQGVGRVPTMITQPEIFTLARDYLGL